MLTEGRPPGQRPSLSHAAIRQKKHLNTIGLPPPQQLRQVGSVGLLTPHSVTPHPSRLCRWRTDQRSSFSFFTVSSSFSPRVLRSPTDSLALRNASFVAESFARPSSPCAPVPVSPLPCLCSDTVYGWYCGWRRCSKVPVSSPFFGSLLDSPFFVL